MEIFWQNIFVYTIVLSTTGALVFHYWKKSRKKTKTRCNDCGCDVKKRLKRL